jgi:hypothetical protein
VISVAEQVPVQAQLRWLTGLQQLGVSTGDRRPAAAVLHARAETAEAVLAVRRDQHRRLVRDTLARLAGSMSGGASLAAAGQTLTDQAGADQPVPGHPLEDLVLDDRVTPDLLSAAPPAPRADLARIAAAQAAITMLRAGHEVTVRATAGRYGYYRRAPELSEAEARAATLLDMHDELDAVCAGPGGATSSATLMKDTRR